MLAGLAVLIPLQWLLCDALFLVGRPLWLDEIHTYLLVTDPDLSHALTALMHGADFNPPLLYLLLRAFAKLASSNGPITFRLFSLVCTISALLGVFWVLRRFFPFLAAVTGMLVVWAHPVVVRQSLEARFYAPLLATTVWLCFFLGRARERRSTWDILAAGVAAALACTVHYFGILSVCAVGGTYLLLGPGLPRRRLLALVPPAIGLLSLLLCTPFYLGQRASLASPTWSEPAAFGVALTFLYEVLPPVLVGGMALMYCVSESIRTHMRRVPSVVPLAHLRSLSGIAGLSIVPFLLIAVSFVAQPALMSRYGITAALGLAPAGALVMERCVPPIRALLVTCLIIISTGWVWVFAQSEQQVNHERDRINASLPSTPSSLTVFELRHDMYPLVLGRPHAQSLRYVLSDAAIGGTFRIVESSVAENIRRFYPRFHTIERRHLPSFFRLVASDDDGNRIRREYPGYSASSVTPRVFALHRRSR